MGIERIVTGGQTGVDRAALDAALAADVPCGGWCPAGRRAEDGPIAPRYPLVEARGAGYRMRTRLNVSDSDGTLILVRDIPGPGTAYTVRCAERMARPRLTFRLDDGVPIEQKVAAVRRWAAENGVHVLNVAGPRESTDPGIGRAARDFLDALCAAIRPPA